MSFKYIKNVHKDKANTFCQSSFYSVEYGDMPIGKRQDVERHEKTARKPRKAEGDKTFKCVEEY